MCTVRHSHPAGELAQNADDHEWADDWDDDEGVQGETGDFAAHLRQELAKNGAGAVMS